MAIWKKRNEEEPVCSSEKGKAFLSDEDMEKVAGGFVELPVPDTNLYTQEIKNDQKQ